MSDFLMPSLGADMERGKLVGWLVKPGSAVHKGDVIAVVETHKGAFEVDVFEEGVVSELCAAEGDEVPVGAVLARIVRSGEAPAIPPAPESIRPAVRATAEDVRRPAPPLSEEARGELGPIGPWPAPSRAQPARQRVTPSMPVPFSAERSIPGRCGRRSPPPCRVPSARSRITIWA